MKNECYIIRDLLPSYIDQLCSKETSEFVEQHISTCEKCAQLQHQMQEEFKTDENLDIPAYLEQKKPFQKISHFFKAQKGYTMFLNITFWICLLITIGFFIHSYNEFSLLNVEREKAQAIEDQKQKIMDETFAILSSQESIDKEALQTVYTDNNMQLQHLAVFSTNGIEDVSHLHDGPIYTFPIDYSKAVIVVGEIGTMTEPIIPNDYDIATVAMANDEWIVQFEYKDAFLDTVEEAHQIKYYSPSNLSIFSTAILFSIITLYILGAWLLQVRISKPVKNILD